MWGMLWLQFGLTNKRERRSFSEGCVRTIYVLLKNIVAFDLVCNALEKGTCHKVRYSSVRYYV